MATRPFRSWSLPSDCWYGSLTDKGERCIYGRAQRENPPGAPRRPEREQEQIWGVYPGYLCLCNVVDYAELFLLVYIFETADVDIRVFRTIAVIGTPIRHLCLRYFHGFHSCLHLPQRCPFTVCRLNVAVRLLLKPQAGGNAVQWVCQAAFLSLSRTGCRQRPLCHFWQFDWCEHGCGVEIAVGL